MEFGFPIFPMVVVVYFFSAPSLDQSWLNTDSDSDSDSAFVKIHVQIVHSCAWKDSMTPILEQASSFALALR